MKFLVLLFSLALVGIDQLLKKIAIDKLLQLPGNSHAVIEDVLHFTYVENRGAAFSILSGYSELLIIVSLCLIIAVTVVMFSKKVTSKFLMWSIGLVIGGGMGNLIDRAIRGFVVDYIDVRLINFAVFNFADCCVVIGTLLIVFYILVVDVKNAKAAGVEKSKPKLKLALDIEDHTCDESAKVNKYITVVGEVVSNDTTLKEKKNDL